MVGIALLSALIPSEVHAWDFTYGYRTINDPGAETYLVDKQNVRKVREWTGSTYWGPNGNDTEATLTYRFDFSAPTTEAHLHAGLTIFNYTAAGFRTDYGSTSIWGSTNGTSWQLLQDGPTPSGVTATNVVYHRSLPASLLGATHLWIQARMQQHDAMLSFQDPSATWTDAQFSRAEPSETNDVFQLQVRFGPALQSGTAAQPTAPVQAPDWRLQTVLLAAGVLVCLGMLVLLVVCLILISVLVRRSGQQLANNAALLRRLDEVARRLEREPKLMTQEQPGRLD